MIQVEEYEVLLASRLRFTPGGHDLCVEFDNDIAVLAKSLTPNVESLARAKACSQDGSAVRNARYWRSVHDWSRKRLAEDRPPRLLLLAANQQFFWELLVTFLCQSKTDIQARGMPSYPYGILHALTASRWLDPTATS